MKLALFAHTPPPPHGQSMMVQRMLEGFGGDRARRRPGPAGAAKPPEAGHGGFGIECYHINARLSEDLEDVGRMRLGKLLPLFGYCLQAVWYRFRYGIDTVYYVPTPPKRASLYRDWVVMLCCRAVYRRIVFHWHAVGLGEWLATGVTAPERAISRWLLRRADLAIVLSKFNQPDAERLEPRAVRVVGNGIADPCPDYATALAPRRTARLLARGKLLEGRTLEPEERRAAGGDPETVHVLFLAHCTRDKGVFDTLDGVERANVQLASQGSPLRLRLTVIGGFLRADEKAEFERRQAAAGQADWLRYLGYVSEPDKWLAFREADLFCFPTYYSNEGQPVNVIEAMAFGLPPVTTRWRSIPELLPEGYPGLIEPRQPDLVAQGLLAVVREESDRLRATFQNEFTLDRHLRALAEALRAERV